jgi:REP element-mobilizing transposase RayT
LLDASLSQTLKAIAQKIAEENNFSIITMQTDKDHIHLLVDYDTTQTVADIVNLEMLPEYASVCEDILTGNKDKYSE